jgi:biopolymer transport protein ExbD
MAFRFNDQGDEEIVAEINITPLTDIFLVLLIIFMISSSAILETALQVKLPPAQHAAPAPSTEPILVTISSEGTITVNEIETAEETLEASIEEALMQTSDKTVLIRGDESIPLGVAVRALDAAQSAGAENVAIGTRSPE